MMDLEQDLRVAFDEGSAHLELPVGLARNSWRRGRRRHRRVALASAGVSMIAAGAATVGVAALARGASDQRISTSSQPPAATRSVGTQGPAGSATCSRGVMYPAAAAPDPALQAICLPDPAPGFPLRRTPDGAVLDGERTFLVGVTPETFTKLPSGAIEGTPTGPEATVSVGHAGADSWAANFGTVYPVIGTTTALGRTATIVQVERGQIGVLVHFDDLDITASGSDWTGTHPVTAEQLVTLIDSLQGLPTAAS